MGYKEDLIIDKHSLDEEWLQQPIKYAQYAEKAEELQDDARRAKDNLETISAEVEKEIRGNHEGEKITEKAIASELIMDERVQQAKEEYLKADHEFRIMKSVAVPAFDQRKTALENLVKLKLSSYYSDPQEPKGSNFKNSAIDKADEKQTKSLNRRRK